MKKLLLSILLLTCSLTGMAKEYKFFIANAAGSGGADTVVRQIADIYHKKTGNYLVPTNAPGGNNIIAATAFKAESKNHISLISISSTMLVWNMLKPMPYSDADFNVIGELGDSPFFYFANTPSGISTPRDLTPQLNRSTNIFVGIADTSSNISLLNKFVNPAITPIMYKSPTDIILGVLSNSVQVGCVSGAIVQLEELEKSGKIKIIGTTFPRPLKVNDKWIPSLPQELAVTQFNGYVGIAITPGDTAEHKQLITDIQTILKSNEIQDLIASLQYKSTGKEAKDFILDLRKRVENASK